MSEHAEALAGIAALLGPSGWITDDDGRAPYEHEARGYWSGTCLGVARPSTVNEVAETVRLAAAAGLAIVPHSGNTGLVSGGVPRGGIVLSTERMTHIRALDPDNMTMTVDAGCILATVQTAASDAGLYFPLSLGAEGSCRIGGNVSTNAGGVAVLRYGNMRDLVLGVEVVLPDGRIWDGLRGLRKDNTGYDLKQLFIGAEGTLGIVTGAVLKLFPEIRETASAMVAVSDWETALAVLNRLRTAAGDTLSACEVISRMALSLVVKHVEGVRDPFPAEHPMYLLVELTSPRADAGLTGLLETELTSAIEGGIAEDALVAQSDAQRAAFWQLRETIPEAQHPEGGSIKHDVAVPVSAIPEFARKARAYVESRVPGIRIVAFGHMGDGNLHFNLSQPPGMAKSDYMALWDEISGSIHDIAMSLGGTFSAEHGIGEIKRHEMARYRTSLELDLMRGIKQAFDPLNLMNPGKIFPDD